MKKLKILGLSSVLATSLFGLQQPNYDYISMSMGGVGVASSYGSMSGYINPALLNNKDNKRTELGLSVGISIQEHELGDDLSKLDDADVSGTLDEIESGDGDNEDTEARARKITDALDSLANKTNNYLMLSPRAAFAFKLGTHFSFGIYNKADAKVKAVVDKDRLQYIYYDEDDDKYIKYEPKDGDDNDYSDSTEDDYKAYSVDYAMNEINTTRLDVNSLALTEIPITYSDSFQIKDTTINWGVSAKYMVGTTSKTKILFTDDDYDPLDELDKNSVDTQTFGLDMGVVIQPYDSGFKLGISGKNLNGPEFDTIDDATYKLEPQVKVGLGYSSTDLFDVEVDYDVNSINDELTDTDYQYLSVGINFHPLTWFSLRAGLKDNLADDYNGMIYTAGASFGLKWLQVDAAVQVSENSGNYDGNDIPRYVNANIAIVSKWGDN